MEHYGNTPDAYVDDSATKLVKRRTVVRGAAWTIPVIATAVATPFAAASTQGTISIITPLPVAVFGTFGDVTITVTTNGSAPSPNTPVTVTLSDPMKFPSGLSTQIFTTDANGKVTISGLKAPGSAGNYTITATAAQQSGTLSTSGTLSVTNASVFTSLSGAAFKPLVGIDNPVKIKVAAGKYLVIDDKGIVYSSGGTKPFVAIPGLVGATSFSAYDYGGAYVSAVGPDEVGYTSYNGAAFTPIAGSNTIQVTQVVAGYTLGLDAAGNLYRSGYFGKPWVQVPSPVPLVDFDGYASSGEYITAIGDNGIAYRSYRGGVFTPIKGSTTIKKIQVGGYYSVGIDASGAVYRAYYSNGDWKNIPLPADVTALDVQVYEPDSNWVIVQGSDGYAYQSYGGAAFEKIFGSASIVQVGVGASYWVGRDSNGVIYRATGSKPWVMIPGLRGANDFSVYAASGDYVAAIGPAQNI